MTRTNNKVAVSLHIFNRPEMTQQVFERIREYRPELLFVVADGPRENHPKDAENCKATRAILDRVDWQCELIKNYSDVNMGSYKRNFSGLSRLFEMVEEAIILEDDCVPDPTFFPFCEELLERYRHDSRIAVISGNNFLPKTAPHGRYSYFFSIMPFMWGWASWRRTWKLVDPDMKNWSEFREKELGYALQNRNMRNYWYKIFQMIESGKLRPAWDYQLMLTCFMQNMLSVIPNVNMVTNIGFGMHGTNCFNPHWPCSNVPRFPMRFPLNHPVSIVPDRDADIAIHFNRYGIPPLKQLRLRIKGKLERMLR